MRWGPVMKRSPYGTVSRARWAAIGAAVAVSLGVGGVAVTNAIVSTGEKRSLHSDHAVSTVRPAAGAGSGRFTWATHSAQVRPIPRRCVASTATATSRQMPRP